MTVEAAVVVDVAATVTATAAVRPAMLARASPRELPPASSSLSSVAVSAEAVAAVVLLPLLSKRWMDTHHACRIFAASQNGFSYGGTRRNDRMI